VPKWENEIAINLSDQNESLKAHVQLLSRRVAMLQVKSSPRRYRGQFGAQLIADAGEDAISDELVDIAREVAISDLTKRNS